MSNPTIPLFKVHMPQDIAEILKPVLLSGYITQGPKSAEFERVFQEYIGNPYTALVNSGTSALTIALRLVGAGPGTEVITSPMTCLAGTQPILTCGATPVWCDIDPATGNMDPSCIEALITPRTKAVMFVDWAGMPAPVTEINDVAHRHGLKTIEDAAQALGSSYAGKKTGTGSDITCFSFQALKHLNSSNGGAIACSTKEDFDRAVLLRWFGTKRGAPSSPVCWEGDVQEPGYKAHLCDIEATIGLSQMPYLDGIVSAHKHNGHRLLSELVGLRDIELCAIPAKSDPSFWIFVIRLRDVVVRSRVSAALLGEGISNSVVHTRNDVYSLFKQYRGVLPGVDDFSSRMLCIPCGWWVSDRDIDYIVRAVRGILC